MEAQQSEPCRDGAVPDRYGLWAQLVQLWVEKQVATDPEAGGFNVRIATWLGCRSQQVAQWKTGSGGRSPAPWHLLMRLAADLGLVIVLDPVKGAQLHRAGPEGT